MQNKTKYYFQFTVLCLGTLLLSYGLSQTQNRYFNTCHFWIPTLFFALTSLGINVLLTKTDKRSQDFVFKTLALSMARLLACMIFVFVYSLINKKYALAFTCHFMIQYLVFTIFEVSFLLKHIKQAN
ncbi:MAG: hypothetical protein H7141_09300 [Burkholderiales bacterium]|nr:hypothetical protein [Bacteroidia bacterium]